MGQITSTGAIKRSERGRTQASFKARLAGTTQPDTHCKPLYEIDATVLRDAVRGNTIFLVHIPTLACTRASCARGQLIALP